MKQAVQFVECANVPGNIQLWGPGSVIYIKCRGCGKEQSYDSPDHDSHFVRYQMLVNRPSKKELVTFYEKVIEEVSKNRGKFRVDSFSEFTPNIRIKPIKK